MEAAARWNYLAELPARLVAAIGAAELDAATRPPELAGVTRSLRPDVLPMGERMFPSPLPRVVVDLDPPGDAGDLFEAWGLASPATPAPVTRVSAGRWEVHLRHPAGRQGSAQVEHVEVAAAPVRSALVDRVHGDARALLDSMAGFYRAWRPGWHVGPGAAFVVVYESHRPVAGGAIEDDGRGTALASRLCVDPDRLIGGSGSSLLDRLEAVAIDRGCTRICLDGSVFLHRSVIPYARHGYVVAPPYDGDADESVWAERSLEATNA